MTAAPHDDEHATRGARPQALRRNAHAAWSFLRVMEEHDAVGAASALAFQAFFSLVPLFALLGWATHALLSTSSRAYAPLFRLTPRAVTTLADAELMRLSEGSAAVLPPLSALGFLWLCSGGAARAMLHFEEVFAAPPRSWLRRRLLATGFVVFSLAVGSACVGIGLLAERLGDGASMLAKLLLPFVALWVLLDAFFRHATARPTRTPRHRLAGVLVTMGSWAVLSMAFSLYVRELANYSRFYGGLASVAVLLFWLWLMALALLLGAELHARLDGVPVAGLAPRWGAPERAEDAARREG